MSKLLLKNSPVKPLPPFVRQRLTLQSALLTNPRYVKNVRFDEKKKEKEIPERESPPKSLVSSKAQTQNVLDAETNTKTGLSSLDSKKSKLKTKCSTWAKEARIVSRSPYMEIARRMKREGSVSQKKITVAGDADSKKDLPGVKRRRGILKKVLEEVQIEGMCSQGTATEGNKPTLERILKENHIFLKYSKNSKPKKKKVRMEKQPAFSYFSKRPEESVQSLEALEEGRKEAEKPKNVTIDDDPSTILSEESLERKPARLALRSPSGHPDADLEDPDGVPDSHLSMLRNRASAPQLNASEKQLHLPRPRKTAQDNCENVAEEWEKSPKRRPCRVPRERLYFKNMFSYLPGMPRL